MLFHVFLHQLFFHILLPSIFLSINHLVSPSFFYLCSPIYLQGILLRFRLLFSLRFTIFYFSSLMSQSFYVPVVFFPHCSFPDSPSRFSISFFLLPWYIFCRIHSPLVIRRLTLRLFLPLLPVSYISDSEFSPPLGSYAHVVWMHRSHPFFYSPCFCFPAFIEFSNLVPRQYFFVEFRLLFPITLAIFRSPFFVFYFPILLQLHTDSCSILLGSCVELRVRLWVRAGVKIHVA